ncbi:Pantoate-beta-alanine ligase [Rickenella mellea]|uniref:Pantoate--beta-alanine ligase n=1 Tax=Rickenella mellea TaxID=50990 RepID=A0A4Y7QHL8_9AGAM|nr:Pantoate-beta-alanine ligase [Rickenella mellea]
MSSLSSIASDSPQAGIPIMDSLKALREWRTKAFEEKKSVGFVPTMGALHEGHISLVKRSLEANDLTLLSIFVNPTQFAPHEDLSSYPRTLPRDLELLSRISVPAPASGISDNTTNAIRKTSAVFVPTVDEMYPSSVSQNLQEQKGTFVEVKGYGEQMEGRSRPTFFRGVATVVTKLFNAVQPTHAYFGQKDIQQGLILRRMVSDLLMAHPTAQNVHIVPTARDPTDGLALSSRNAYLSPTERSYADTLYRMLKAGEDGWDEGGGREEVVRRARGVFDEVVQKAGRDGEGVQMRLDYVEVNDPWTFEVVEGNERNPGTVLVLSGALWIGRTRLIDNILLGDASKIIY